MFENKGISQKLVTIVCASLITMFPMNRAQAQTGGVCQSPSGWQSSKLSQAVVKDARQAMLNVLIANQSGRLTASVLENAATSLQVYYDHFEEIGLNAAVQKQILANKEAFLDFHRTDVQVQEQQSKLASQGINVSISELRSAMDPGFEQRQAFLSMVESIGLYQTELQFVARIRAEAGQLAPSEDQLSARRMFSRKWHPIRAGACALCYVSAAVGLATGCIVEPVCWMAVGSCFACATG